jgi:hypothetical protein
MIFKKLNLKFYVARSLRQCKTQIHLQDVQIQKYKLWNVTWISNNTQLTQKFSSKFWLSNFTNHQNVMCKQNTQHCHDKFDEIIS